MAKKSREQRKLERPRPSRENETAPSSAPAPKSGGAPSSGTAPSAPVRERVAARPKPRDDEREASPRRHDAEIAEARAARAAHAPAAKKRGNPALVLAGLVALAGLLVWLAQRPSASTNEAPKPDVSDTKELPVQPPPPPAQAALPLPPVVAASAEVLLSPPPSPSAEVRPAEPKPAEIKPPATKPVDAKGPAPKPAAKSPAAPAAPAPKPASDDVY